MAVIFAAVLLAQELGGMNSPKTLAQALPTTRLPSQARRPSPAFAIPSDPRKNAVTRNGHTAPVASVRPLIPPALNRLAVTQATP